MVFIVEMVWGRPPGATVYDADNNLLDFIPDEEPPDPEWRHFECNDHAWKNSLARAKKHGWKPAGTLVPPRSLTCWKANDFDPSYAPEQWGYQKMVGAEDAVGLADALERSLTEGEPAESTPAGPILIVEGMTAEQLEAANQPMSAEFLRKFIAFLRRGPFVSAWDD